MGARASGGGGPRADRRGGRDRLGLREQRHDEQQHQQHDLDSGDHHDDIGAAHDDNHHVERPAADQHDHEHGFDDHDLHQHHFDLHQGQWRWRYLPVAL
jgi:hypothetical protein